MSVLASLLTQVADIERRARAEFSSLDPVQLNWSPHEGKWSIAECLDHLITTNTTYFPIFDTVANGTKRDTFWERLPILPRLWGAALINTVRPETTRKSRAPRIFQPHTGTLPADVLDTFLIQQRKLTDAITALNGIDIDKTIVTSPVAVFIAYSLRDALSIVVLHEERHLRQAERVLALLTSRNSG